MIRVVDKLLLFFYSILIGIASVVAVSIGFAWIPRGVAGDALKRIYQNESYQLTAIVLGIVLFIVSLRFLFVSLTRGSAASPSIDQRTDYGDIRISMETVENLALKAASRQRGVKDLRARIRASEAGLDIVIRAVVDGESPIPALTEDIQRTVKEHVEEITGIPVANVAVFVANIIQAGPTYKSRVE
ncbi:alkaline shock response membrane anchor protein AmaP [Paenibacillus sp. GCM10023252]|uniref:alkaline shock response membrane anchor protein AmaP n=1 Tax=Paenibacillus sp. GCM10023252 TaxID=3252649 RepID=UPI0036219D62